MKVSIPTGKIIKSLNKEALHGLYRKVRDMRWKIYETQPHCSEEMYQLEELLERELWQREYPLKSFIK